jgi:hypothetical protein
LAFHLTRDERDKIARRSILLKEKFIASCEYDKLKARLVAGGSQQDKGLYENPCLSFPAASTTSVMTIAGDISSTCVTLNMRMIREITDMLVHINSKQASSSKSEVHPPGCSTRHYTDVSKSLPYAT